MSGHHGTKLKRILVLNEKKPEDLAPLIDKAASTIYTWFRDEAFPKDRIELLKSVGIDVAAAPEKSKVGSKPYKKPEENSGLEANEDLVKLLKAEQERTRQALENNAKLTEALANALELLKKK